MISVHYLSTHWGRRYAFAPPQTPRGSVDGGDPVASLKQSYDYLRSI